MNTPTRILICLALTASAIASGSAAGAGGLTRLRADRSFGFGEWAQAGALYELLLDSCPSDAAAYSRAIVAAGMLGDSLRPADLLSRAMAHGVALDSVAAGVREAAMEAGHAAAYEEFLVQTRARMPYMARAIDARLLAYYEFRNDGPGIVALSEAMLRGLPDSVRYLRSLARGHMLQGHTAQAEAAWRHVLELDADNVDTLRDLGCMLMAENRADEGRKLLARAQQLAPTPYVESLLGR